MAIAARPLRWSLLLPLALLSGCGGYPVVDRDVTDRYETTRKDIEQESPRVMQGKLDSPFVRHAKTVWIGSQPVPFERGSSLPPQFDELTLNFTGRHNIGSVVEILQRATGLRIMIHPDVLVSMRELAQTPPGFDDWEAASAYMRALRPSVTEAARQQRLREMLRPREGGGLTWQYDLAGIAATRLNPDPARVVDLAPHVRALACPTLVVRGGRSDYLQPAMAQAMAEANPHVRWIEIADAGHYVHDDQPEVFHRVVRAFLLDGRVEAPGATGAAP